MNKFKEGQYVVARDKTIGNSLYIGKVGKIEPMNSSFYYTIFPLDQLTNIGGVIHAVEDDVYDAVSYINETASKIKELEHKTVLANPFPFNIDLYIPEEKRKEIAEDIFKTRMNEYIDDVISRRVPDPVGLFGITDLAVQKAANQFIAKLPTDAETDFLELMKKIIKGEVNTSEDISSFIEQAQYSVDNAFREFLKDNENARSHLEKTVTDVINSLSKDRVVDIILKELDVNTIIKNQIKVALLPANS